MQDDVWPDPDLKPLPVDLEELADALEGDPLQCGGIIDLDTGEVWPRHLMDLLSDEEGVDWDKKVENRLVIDELASRAAYQDICDFIAGLTGGTLARRLDHAIGGRGAFRRFKDVLTDHPAELESYYRFTRTRKIDRAAAWLAECGYQAAVTQGGG
ncbi:MAG TPA: UPF0158 family protein [Trebonia sp.]|jgi:hypothetical protein